MYKVLITLLFLFPSFAIANTWTYEEDFEDWSVGNWYGIDSWTSTFNNAQIYSVGAIDGVYSGARKGSRSDLYRVIDGGLDGEMYFDFYTTSNTALAQIALNKGAYTDAILLYVYTDGDIRVYNGGSLVDTGVNIPNNTKVRIGIKWNGTAGTWQYSKDGGAWSTSYSYYSGTGAITRLYLDFNQAGSADTYFDNFSPCSVYPCEEEITDEATTTPDTTTKGDLGLIGLILLTFAWYYFIVHLHGKFFPVK